MLWSDPEQAESSKGAMTLWGACGRVPDPQYKRSSEQPCSVLPSAPGRQWHWPRLAGGPPGSAARAGGPPGSAALMQPAGCCCTQGTGLSLAWSPGCAQNVKHPWHSFPQQDTRV